MFWVAGHKTTSQRLYLFNFQRYLQHQKQPPRQKCEKAVHICQPGENFWKNEYNRVVLNSSLFPAGNKKICPEKGPHCTGTAVKKSFALFLNVAVHFCQEQIYNFMGTALYFQLEIKRENDSKDVTAILMFYVKGSLFPARDEKGKW